MTGKQSEEDWMIEDERGAASTLPKAWHTVEHGAHSQLYDTLFCARA